MVELAVVGACIVAMIAAYFGNNPLRHGRWFMWRRFINWFPLGMTYSFLYMARYNLVVAKNAMGPLMSTHDYSNIAAIGTATYAFSFLINGPLVDKIGGKRGMMIGAWGAALANVAMGWLTERVTTGHAPASTPMLYSLLYALNMYFQSYGGVSIIKVKAYWFHVRERGVFGAIFGALISLGLYFAFDWNNDILHFVPKHVSAVFYVPAAIIVLWAISDIWFIADAPDDVGFPHLDTADASSGLMDVNYTFFQLLGKVFASPLMWIISLVSLTSGVFRNGVQSWYQIFAKAYPQHGAEFIANNWGFLLCVTGIAAGFAAGLTSDKLFQSRRAPPAAIMCLAGFLFALLMHFSLHSSPWVLGLSGIAIVMCAVGMTSLMSGTAGADFGGRKATATCAGIVDGFAYLGGAIQFKGIGLLVAHSWNWWPLFFLPFALLGGFLALRIWNALPPATKRYIEHVEHLKTNAEPETA